MSFSFAIIDSTATTALKFIGKVKIKKTWILRKCEKINQLALSPEYNSKSGMQLDSGTGVYFSLYD